MSTAQRINLTGFEEALQAFIVENFTFLSDDFLKDKPLVPGRNIFVNDVPDDDEVKQTSPDFDPNREPIIGLFITATPGVRASSGTGSKLDWGVRTELGYGTVTQGALNLLSELHEFLFTKATGARMGDFIVRGIESIAKPLPFRREGDDRRLASSNLRMSGISLT